MLTDSATAIAVKLKLGSESTMIDVQQATSSRPKFEITRSTPRRGMKPDGFDGLRFDGVVTIGEREMLEVVDGVKNEKNRRQDKRHHMAPMAPA